MNVAKEEPFPTGSADDSERVAVGQEFLNNT